MTDSKLINHSLLLYIDTMIELCQLLFNIVLISGFYNILATLELS